MMFIEYLLGPGGSAGRLGYIVNKADRDPWAYGTHISKIFFVCSSFSFLVSFMIDILCLSW